MAAGVPGLRLMERAGRAVADCIGAARPAPASVAVLCGPGNNGGDGYVIARVLAGRGYGVTLYATVPTDRLAGDAATMAGQWQGLVHPPQRFLADAPADIVVDALFGTGLARAVDGPAAAMIARANDAPEATLRVAVDIPSGISGDTGEELGIAFRAGITVTFHARKPGHLLLPGRLSAGRVLVADIGLGEGATGAARLESDGPELIANDAAPLVAGLGGDPQGHKYTRGHALVLAGGMEGTGAARLAARGALRAGAGLVTLGVPGSALLAHAAHGPDALMLRRAEGAEGLAALLADRRRNAVVLGPALGVGPATRDLVAVALGADRPVVLDADALTSFAGEAEALAALTAASGRAVLTPHAGEFARLMEGGPVSAPLSRLHGALAAAARFGAVVVLKGADTIIAAPDGHAAINHNAPPWLGTAGSGDVLAGIIGGLLAQGLAPYAAARAGVWLHGEAGRIAGRGLIADDLPEALHRVWAEMGR